MKEWVSDHRHQTTSAIRNYYISTKFPKAKLKDFTIIDRDSNTLHHWAKEALHICIKDPSLNRNTGKVRIPSVFNKLLKPPRQLELPHSSIPHPRGALFYLIFQHERQLTFHTFLISIYNRSVKSMFKPSNFKTTKPLDFHLERNIGKHFSHITKCHLLQKISKLQVLWSFSSVHQTRLKKELVSSENVS